MQPDIDHSSAWPGRFRAYLQILANMHMDQQLQAKMDPSDIVQQTALQPFRAIDGFRGEDDARKTASLRQLLTRNITHAARDLQRAKRDVRRGTVTRGCGWAFETRAEGAADGAKLTELTLVAAANRPRLWK